MPTWKDFKKSVGYYADKTAKKTRELTDTASLKIKIASKEADRDSEYKNLGKLTYSKLKSEDEKDSEKLTREIADSIKKLDGITRELCEMRAEEEKRRAEKAARAAQKEAEKDAGSEKERPEETSEEPKDPDPKTDSDGPEHIIMPDSDENWTK